MIFQDRLERTCDKAEDAFWSVIAKEFSEATSGDFAPDALYAFQEAVHDAVMCWVNSNCPQVKYELGQYVRYTSANTGEAQSSLGVVVEDGVECVDPEIVAQLDADGVSVVCHWDGIADIEPFIMPSDASLIESITNRTALDRETRLVLSRRSDDEAQRIMDLHLETFGEL